MTDVSKPVLSKLQITGDWRVKCKPFVNFAASKKKSKQQGNLKTTQYTCNPPPLLQHSLFEKQSANEQMRQPARKGGIHHTRDPDMSHDLHMHSGSCIKCFPSRE